MASIEFGILWAGSSITLDGKFRANTYEEVFWELEPMFQEITSQTGIEFDTHSSAAVEGSALETFVLYLQKWQQREFSDETKEFLNDLLRVASYAMQNEKMLSYFGL